jgi:hypothetical protein
MGAAGAGAEPFPVSHLDFNPKLNVSIVNLKVQTNRGFLLNASAGEYEIVIKGTPMGSETSAAEMAKVEMANIKNLYNPRGSPYAGQISDVIQCEKAFLPETPVLKVLGRQVTALIGGTNGRKLFGACTHDQIEFYAEYFTFFDAKDMREVDVRVFRKFSPEKAHDISRRLREFTAKLFVDQAP